MHSENQYEITFMVGGGIYQNCWSLVGRRTSGKHSFSLELQTNYFNMHEL